MTLDEYRRAKEMTTGGLAKLLGIAGVNPYATVARYLRHERIPDLGTLRAIEEKTEGAVTVADWPARAVRPAPTPATVPA